MDQRSRAEGPPELGELHVANLTDVLEESANRRPRNRGGRGHTPQWRTRRIAVGKGSHGPLIITSTVSPLRWLANSTEHRVASGPQSLEFIEREFVCRFTHLLVGRALATQLRQFAEDESLSHFASRESSNVTYAIEMKLLQLAPDGTVAVVH